LIRTIFPVTVAVCFVLSGCAAPIAAQSSSMRQVAYLKASNPAMYAHFGEGGALPGHTGNTVSISADGNTIAVGAPHEASAATGINGNEKDDSASNAGAVYIYTRNGGNWVQQAYVKASNTGSGDYFGSSVDLSADGNTLAVAAHWEASDAKGINGNQADNSIPQAGAVYIFTRSGGRWAQQAYIKSSNTGEKTVGEELVGGGDGDQFGFSLALSADGDTLAVGAVGEDSTATGINGNQTDNAAVSAGAVYTFRRTGSTWTQQAYIKPQTPAMFAAGDLFGFSLGLSADGNTLAVGVYDEGGSARGINGMVDNMRGGSGAAYIFSRTGATWMQQAYIKTSISEGGDSWGVSLALSDDGNTLALGSVDEDCTATGVNPPGCDTDIKTDVSTGAVAIFIRGGTTWSQQALLKSSNTGVEDWFGVKVALSGDGNALVVTASNEDSAAQGIDGKQDDDTATESGAAYVFTRTGATWAQQAYVKSSANEAFDEFGNSASISRNGRTLVVGGRGEDGGKGGVNQDAKDNSVDESGAAFVFTR
jgi:FG-GAP repeat